MSRVSYINELKKTHHATRWRERHLFNTSYASAFRPWTRIAQVQGGDYVENDHFLRYILDHIFGAKTCNLLPEPGAIRVQGRKALAYDV